MELMRDLPGFKPILKAVLRQQIQQLVEQLSEYTDEETVVLSANVSDGTLSHLGSKTGKIFLETENEIKSRFLGFCLKSNLSPPKCQTESPAYSADQFFHNSNAGVSDQGLKRKVEYSAFSNNKRFRDSDNSREIYRNSSLKKDSDSITGADRTNNSELDGGQLFGNTIDNVNNVTESSDIDLTVVKVENSYEMMTDRSCDMYSKVNNQFTGHTEQRDVWRGTRSADSFTGNQGIQSQGQSGVSGISVNPIQNQPHVQLPGGEASDNSWMLDEQQMRHMRMFQCSFCNKEFREKTNLRVHERVHTGEKPYSCGICAKSFAHSSNLRQHERAVHKLMFTSPQYKRQFYNEMEALVNAGSGSNKDARNTYNEEIINSGIDGARNAGNGEIMKSGIGGSRNAGNGEIMNTGFGGPRNAGNGELINSGIAGIVDSGHSGFGEPINSGSEETR